MGANIVPKHAKKRNPKQGAGESDTVWVPGSVGKRCRSSAKEAEVSGFLQREGVKKVWPFFAGRIREIEGLCGAGMGSSPILLALRGKGLTIHKK